MYLFYSFLLTLALLVGLPYFVYRGLRTGKYWPSLRERLGFLPASLNARGQQSIWIHAVSVGEVIATRPILPLLRERFADFPVFVSVTTLTGRQVAERQLRDADGVFFCPFDWAWIVKRAVRRIQPRLLLLVDTEIWPHLTRACHDSGAVVLLVNGRISDTSYPRYRRIRPFMRRFLKEIDCFCMQSPRYRERIIDLGAEPDRVEVVGSLKFDADVPGRGKPSVAAQLVPSDRPVIVVGSTLAPEEEILLEAFGELRKDHSELFLVLAPRHPDRFDEVAQLASSPGWKVVRRTALDAPPREADVMILDTIGELASVYGRADMVFVGGSLATWGGHNLVEPAIVGKPIVFGPHMSNFKEMARMFIEADAAIQVDNRERLTEALKELMRDPDRRTSLGKNASELVRSNRGAGQKTVEIAHRLLETAR
jgi:3-deoxy-D-manno-octulosonic-acid transferase